MSTAIFETTLVSSKVSKGPLSPEQVASYRENGFMKLEQVIEPEIVQGLLSRAKQRRRAATRHGIRISHIVRTKGKARLISRFARS